MARAIWTGSIGFGLVQIPVGLHAAEESAELKMTMLDKRNFAPVGYERVNKKTGKGVPWEQIVKGYEHSEGKFVVLTEEDFAEANVEATRQIDILDFVKLSEVDPRFFDRPYYLVPQKAGKKAYALLREVLSRTGKAGIGKVVIRTRQHLAAVVAHESALLLLLLRFADELRDAKGLDLPTMNLKTLGVTPKELNMAERLIEGMVSKFEPEKYEDEYHRDLQKLIQRKAKAGELNRVPEVGRRKRKAPTTSPSINLAELLAQSVQGAKRPPYAANENDRHPPKSKLRRAGSVRAKPTKARVANVHAEAHHRKSA